MESGTLLGAAAALVSAASWALAAILWRFLGEDVAPAGMNLGKAVLGSCLLGGGLFIAGSAPIGREDLLLLVLSGLLGIALGDTLFFYSLMHLGPGLSVLLAALTPVCIAVASALFLGERHSVLVWTGIGATVGGIVWVLLETSPDGGVVRDKAVGIRYGLLSLVCVTIGIILAKKALSTLPAIQAAAIRLAAGAGGLALWGMLRGDIRAWVAPFREPRIMRRICYVVLISSFGGFWLSLVALKKMDAAVAGVLTATTPLFVLPMAALAFKERVPLKALAGTALAVAGVGLTLAAM